MFRISFEVNINNLTRNEKQPLLKLEGAAARNTELDKKFKNCPYCGTVFLYFSLRSILLWVKPIGLELEQRSKDIILSEDLQFFALYIEREFI